MNFRQTLSTENARQKKEETKKKHICNCAIYLYREYTNTKSVVTYVSSERESFKREREKGREKEVAVAFELPSSFLCREEAAGWFCEMKRAPLLFFSSRFCTFFCSRRHHHHHSHRPTTKTMRRKDRRFLRCCSRGEKTTKYLTIRSSSLAAKKAENLL